MNVFPQEVAVLSSGSQKPEYLFKTYFQYLCDKKHTSLERAHRKSHQLQQSWQPNQTLWLTSSCNHLGWQSSWIT